MYSYKEIRLKNNKHKRKRLIIQFESEQYDLLASFIMIEIGNKGKQFLEQLDLLFAGNYRTIENNGNISSWYITDQVTYIEDLFYDENNDIGMEPIKMGTNKLYAIVKDWTETLKHWEKKGTLD